VIQDINQKALEKTEQEFKAIPFPNPAAEPVMTAVFVIIPLLLRNYFTLLV
jgi:hypothetical protein